MADKIAEQVLECVWTAVESMWETSCGHAFEFNDGTPEENGAKFCQYCGRRISEK